jgi:Leucine-rich repeat (LRR) protein
MRQARWLVPAVLLLFGTARAGEKAALEAVEKSGGKVERKDGKLFIRWPERARPSAQALAGLKGLEVALLRLPAPAVTDDVLGALARADKLHVLAVYRPLTFYPDARSTREKLDLTAARVTDAGLKHLDGRKGLRALVLAHTKVSGAGLAGRKALAGLRELDLSTPAATDGSLAGLEGLTKLRVLRLRFTRVGNAGLKHLGPLTKLEELDLTGTAVTDTAGLGGLSSLKRLSLWSTKTAGGLGGLAPLKALVRLNLARTGVTDADLKHIAKANRLEALNLSATKVTDAGLKHLAGLTALKELNLYDCPVTARGLAHLAGAKTLDNLHLSPRHLTDDVLHLLAARGLLHALSQAYGPEARPAKRDADVRRLELRDSPVGDRGLEAIKGLTALAELNLYDNKVTDAGLAHITGLKGLRRLLLTGPAITDKGLAHLSALTGLRELFLPNTAITDEGLKGLARLPHLSRLTLSQTAVTDAGLKHLHALKSLTYLDVSRTKVTPAGVAELRKAFPKALISR